MTLPPAPADPQSRPDSPPVPAPVAPPERREEAQPPLVLSGDGWSAEAFNVEYDPERDTLILTGSPRLTRGDTVLTADRIEYVQDTGQATAVGAVTITRGDQVIRALSATYNVKTGEGRAQTIRTITEELLIAAEEVVISPTRMTAVRATVTTCGGNLPYWQVFARRIEIIPRERWTAEGAGINLFGQRVATVPHLSRALRKKKKKKRDGAERLTQVLPNFGYNERDKVYLQQDMTVMNSKAVNAGLSARLSAGRLLTGRVDAESKSRVRVVGTVGYREYAPNQRAPYLEYSRLPEVGLIYGGTGLGTGSTFSGRGRFLPFQVGEIAAAPTPQNRSGWQYGVELSGGYFSQRKGQGNLPQNVNLTGSRALFQVQAAKPGLRIGPVRFDALRMLFRQSVYNTGDAFSVFGAGISKSWKLGPVTAGLERIGHVTAGTTPFLFDSLEIPAEWRPTANYRVRDWNFLYMGRFNESRGTFYDHLFSISKRMDCIEPRVGISTRLGLVSFDISLIGLDKGARPPRLPGERPGQLREMGVEREEKSEEAAPSEGSESPAMGLRPRRRR